MTHITISRDRDHRVPSAFLRILFLSVVVLSMFPIFKSDDTGTRGVEAVPTIEVAGALILAFQEFWAAEPLVVDRQTGGSLSMNTESDPRIQRGGSLASTTTKGLLPFLPIAPRQYSRMTIQQRTPIVSHKPKVLVFSTGDSTRSQMAEGFLRNLASNELVPASTSVQSLDISPLAAEVMKEVGVDISGQHAKDVAHSLKEHFACVVTVCDADTERFPIWPFTPNVLHWNLRDPEQTTGSPEQQREAFRQVRDAINHKVQEFIYHTLPTLHSTTRPM